MPTRTKHGPSRRAKELRDICGIVPSMSMRLSSVSSSITNEILERAGNPF